MFVDKLKFPEPPKQFQGSTECAPKNRKRRNESLLRTGNEKRPRSASPHAQRTASQPTPTPESESKKGRKFPMPQASKYNYTIHDVIYFVGYCVCTFTVLSPRAACYYMRIDEISTDFVISRLILGKLLRNCQIHPFLYLYCTCVLNSIPYFRISAEGVTFIIRNKKHPCASWKTMLPRRV